ncbi:MAG: insulinase family protein [Elusimicrobia bacterium]|nr:insulinase family protein [Candidatus Obscuribacterium magneticum]
MMTRSKLSNGLRLLFFHTPNDPISACHLFLPGGASREPLQQRGISTLLWSLLLKGTKQRSAQHIIEAIESLGAHIGAHATHDYSQASCHSLSEYFTETLAIMSDVLFKPAFLPEEVEKEKAALQAAIRAKKESILTVASEELNLHLYGKHPYAHPTSGTEETIVAITPEDLHRWHKTTVIPNGGVLSVTSNVSLKKLRPELDRLFGKDLWPRASQAKLLKDALPRYPKKTIEKSRQDPFEQAFLMMAFPAPRIFAKDYIALKVLTALLGGGMSSRLFQNLREKEGLAYEVGAFYPSRKNGSAFIVYLGLQASRLPEAKKRIIELLKDTQRQKVSSEELDRIKSFLKGSFILEQQTNSQRSYYLGWWEVLGLDASYNKKYIKALEKVTPRDLQQVAKKVFDLPSVTVEILPKQGGQNN